MGFNDQPIATIAAMTNLARGGAFFLLIGLAACAGSPATRAPIVSRPAGGGAVAADAADAIARLRADVEWLAADERRGRRAGSAEADASAAYLAAELTQLGLEGAGDNGGMLHVFDVPMAPDALPGSRIQFRDAGGTEHEAGDGTVLPLFCSEAGSIEARWEFCGFGIDSADQQWNDFAAVDLHGKVAVILRGVPPASELLPAPAPAAGEPAHASSFEASGSIFLKVMNAKRHGAVGVILLQEAGAEQPLAFDPSQPARSNILALSAPRSVFARMTGEARARDAFERAARRGGLTGWTSDGGSVRMVAQVRRASAPTSNVLARLRGRDPARTVVIGAHYDHLGIGGEGSLAPGEYGAIHNGADDNASGTAAVLEMARRLSRGPKPAGDVIFALWSGEELGLLGSEAWCAANATQLRDVRANLNLDMVGRARAPGSDGPATLTVLGAGTSQAFEGWLKQDGPARSLELRVHASGFGTGGSDHMSFMKRKVPVLHFFTGVHADYHKPSDDSERVDLRGIAQVVDLGLDMIARIQAADEVAWNPIQPSEDPDAKRKPMASDSGFRVWFGSIPDYAHEGPGVLLTGTSAGSPAEKAGMLAGDLLLGVGDVQIDTIHDFVYALSIYKPGDVVQARFRRGDSELSVRLTLATRAAQ